MNCIHCVFYERLQINPANPPCSNCSTDISDKGYCVAVMSDQGYVPVVTKIIEEAQAREIIQRGTKNGGNFQLLRWSPDKGAYLFT